MTIDKFSLEQFQAALPEGSVNKGIQNGEYVFHVPVDKSTVIVVRSTIDESGFAAEVGEDSIRVVLLDSFDGRPIAPKINAYTTRAPGWETRLKLKIDMYKYYREQAGDCPVCHEPRFINRGQRPGKFYGKLFASCSNWNHNSFKPITEYDEKQAESQEAKADKIIIPPHPTIKEVDNSMLNQYQLEIVDNGVNGITVISAGAGSGKTRVMSHAAATLITHGVNPLRILVVTFNTSAASEVRVRIAKMLYPDITQPEVDFYSNPYRKEGFENFDFGRDWIEADPVRKFLIDNVCTIHAFNFRSLKSFGLDVKACVDQWERMAMEIVKDSLDEFKWTENPKSVRICIARAINSLVEPYRAKQFFDAMFQYADIPPMATTWLSEIYSRYMRFMRKNKLVDFDMMQAEVLKLLHTNAEFKARIQGLFDDVLIDEAQDTNYLQTEILWTVADKCRNMMFVGDTRQSMYRWRGAVPDVMESLFDARWGANVQRLPLPINYRSTKVIVEQSNKLIKLNYLGEKEKYLYPAEPRPDAEDGEPLQYYEYDRFADFGNDLARIILESNRPQDWFVLSRTRAECAAIHLWLIKNKIPAQNLSGGILFGAPHIRKVLAYAQLACNWQDARNNQEILTEVANVASDRFISPTTRRRHLDTCTNEKPWIDCGCPTILEEGIDHAFVRYYGKENIAKAFNWDGVIAQQGEVNKGGYPTMASRGAADLVYYVGQIEKYKSNAAEAIKYIIETSVLPWLCHEKGVSQDDPGEDSDAEDFDVLKTLIDPSFTLEQFLQSVDELTKGGKGANGDSVHIMTVHASKGSERPLVAFNMTRCPIVPPKPKKQALPVSSPVSKEDERNIAYVAITRAKERCFLFGSREWNGMEVDRSTFLNEMDVVMPRELITDNPDIVGEDETEDE